MEINQDLKNFIKNYLIDIEYTLDSNIVSLVFDKLPTVDFTTLSNYQDITNYKVNFVNTLENQPNSDPIETLRKFKEILRVAKNNIKSPTQYYHDLMELILSVGAPFSSFIEILLANMFLTDAKSNTLWRYDQSQPIKLKLGDKTLANRISPLLGLLYQQNSKSIDNIEFLDSYIDSDKLTIYEKIFLEKF